MEEKKQREKPPAGVFDKKNKPTVADAVHEDAVSGPEDKDNFVGPFEQQADEIKTRVASQKKNVQRDYAEQAASNINKTMDSPDPFEDETVTENDMKLAEKLIFDGFAECEAQIPNFPDQKFTICSTNAEEISIIDEIIFDMLKSKERPDGTFDIAQNNVTTMRNALTVALGYRGRNQTEICTNRTEHLNTIKRAIIKVGDLESEGNLKAAAELKQDLKGALLKRARKIKQLPTAIIDFLADEKFKFDKKMYTIMTAKTTIPKS